MSVERTACNHRGNTFFGDFETLGEGPETLVRVRYHGSELERKMGRLQAETIAAELLKELVVLEAVSVSVAKGEATLQRQRSAYSETAHHA